MITRGEWGPGGDGATGGGGGGEPDPRANQVAFSGVLEDSAEDLYEHAPCGYLSTLLDGQIVKINQTLLGWLGRSRAEVVGQRRFADLLTVGGQLYHETHFAPLLRMQGEIGGIALELVTGTGDRLPVLVTSKIKTDFDGQPMLIRTTVFDARDRRAYERELLRARQDADTERQRVQHLATTLQRTLLPPVLPRVPGLQVAAHYHHASLDEVGGDFYDLFPLPENRWGMFLGDVCGKGASAASLTSLTRYTLRAAATYDPDPVSVLATLNTVLNQESRGDGPRLCTVIFATLTPHPDGYDVVLASGGHPPALLLAADGSVSFQPTDGGQLLGALPDAAFVTTAVRLGPGDCLLLYTDGLTEARVGAGPERYEEEGLYGLAAAVAPTTAPELIGAVQQVLARFGDGVQDDVAVLALGVAPTG